MSVGEGFHTLTWFPPEQATNAKKGSRYIALLFNLGLNEMCGQQHAPAALLQGVIRYLLYIWGLLGRIAGLEDKENSPQEGLDSRTFQPVASRYSDWAIHSD